MEPMTTLAFAALLGTSSLSRAHRGDFINFNGGAPQSTSLFDAGLDVPARKGPPPSYNERSEAVAALWALREVRDGWDGGDGLAPTEEAIDVAEFFLYALPYGVETPRVGLANDGEVGLYWETDGFYADVGIYPDGTFGYYASSPQGECSAEGCSFDDGLPEHLIAHLPSIRAFAQAA